MPGRLGETTSPAHFEALPLLSFLFPKPLALQTEIMLQYKVFLHGSSTTEIDSPSQGHLGLPALPRSLDPSACALLKAEHNSRPSVVVRD